MTLCPSCCNVCCAPPGCRLTRPPIAHAPFTSLERFQKTRYPCALTGEFAMSRKKTRQRTREMAGKRCGSPLVRLVKHKPPVCTNCPAPVLLIAFVPNPERRPAA